MCKLYIKVTNVSKGIILWGFQFHQIATICNSSESHLNFEGTVPPNPHSRGVEWTGCCQAPAATLSEK